MMHVYIIVELPDSEEIDASIRKRFDENDRCQLKEGVWLVRSKRIATGDVLKALEMTLERSGLVAKVPHLAGFADSDVVEKLDGWWSDA